MSLKPSAKVFRNRCLKAEAGELQSNCRNQLLGKS
jgi:hypothetical protein